MSCGQRPQKHCVSLGKINWHFLNMHEKSLLALWLLFLQIFFLTERNILCQQIFLTFINIMPYNLTVNKLISLVYSVAVYYDTKN